MRSIKAALLVLSALGLVAAFTASPAGAAADRTTYTFNAGMNGQREVPGPGDQNGSGHAPITVDTASGQICWELRVRNIDGTVTAAHIHAGDRDVAGPVAQALTPPVDGASAGCVVNTEVANAIAANPSGYYVNVHSTTFPNGAVRGQLAGPQT